MTDPGIAFEIGSLTVRWYGLLICAGDGFGRPYWLF
jgi:prolipoprotein diacylglyceryltransferase